MKSLTGSWIYWRSGGADCYAFGTYNRTTSPANLKPCAIFTFSVGAAIAFSNWNLFGSTHFTHGPPFLLVLCWYKARISPCLIVSQSSLISQLSTWFRFGLVGSSPVSGSKNTMHFSWENEVMNSLVWSRYSFRFSKTVSRMLTFSGDESFSVGEYL